MLVCSGCHSMEPLVLLKRGEGNQQSKYSIPTVRHSISGPGNRCIHCLLPLHQIGPIYLAPIHSKPFVTSLLERLKSTPEAERLGTHGRLQGVLTMVNEELDDVLYYEHNQMANVVKVSVPKSQSVRSAILNAGFKVSGSHCNPRAIKTNAPMHLLWDIYRQVVSLIKTVYDSQINVFSRLKTQVWIARSVWPKNQQDITFSDNPSPTQSTSLFTQEPSNRPRKRTLYGSNAIKGRIGALARKQKDQ